MLYLSILKRKDFLINEIKCRQQQLLSYPDGELHCVKNGKYINNLCLLNGKYIYIPRKNSSLVENLAEKKFLTASLFDMQMELKAINSFLKVFNKYPSRYDKLLSNSNYQSLIPKTFKPISEELYTWSKEDYEHKPTYEEALRHPCISGNTVRSKSEVLIDQALFLHKIPYRYEDVLTLNNGISLYPGFTIRHPLTGEYFYWEHFGMMDTPSYAHKAAQKIENYCLNGIIPSVNLILTYETKNVPLSQLTIEKIIHDYFL